MVTQIGLALVALVGLSAAGVGAYVYLASTVPVSYNVVAVPPTEVTPFDVDAFSVGPIAQGGESAITPVVIHNTDSQAHVLGLSAMGVPAGDSMVFYSSSAGAAYVPVSVSAGGSVTVYVKVVVGQTTGSKSIQLRCTPS
jgi:hypothetical protein